MLKAVVLAVVCGTFLVAESAIAVDFSKNITIESDLGNWGYEAAIDHERDLIYVSMTYANQVAVVSSVTGEIVDQIFVGSGPRGIDLSHDGQTVYVALNQAAAIAVIDLDTYDVSEIVVGNELGSSLVWDVEEAQPGRVFVSANPGSGGISGIIQVDIESGMITSAGNGRVMRAGPKFHEDPTGEFLYVGVGFSPNSLYKLDLSQPEAPIALEDDHGAVSGTQHAVVSPDGTRIFLSGSQVLRTDSFLLAGQTTNGRKDITQDGETLFAAAGRWIRMFNTQTYLEVDAIELSETHPIVDFQLLENDKGYMFLSNNTLTLNVPSICLNDFTNDNQMNINDVSAFIELYNANSIEADLDLSGSLNYLDIHHFIQSFALGCE